MAQLAIHVYSQRRRRLRSGSTVVARLLARRVSAPPGRPVRSRPFGRVQAAVLATVHESGGIAGRDAALRAAFPQLTVPPNGRMAVHPEPASQSRLRSNAESTVSRAIVALERRGLIARVRNLTTGHTTLRATGLVRIPDWEEVARAEDAFATHCYSQAERLARLAERAVRRAATIRIERSTDIGDPERRIDVAELECINRSVGAHHEPAATTMSDFPESSVPRRVSVQAVMNPRPELARPSHPSAF